MGDQRTLADPLMRPSQLDAGCLSQLHQPPARSMHELGVGRKGHHLRLPVGPQSPWRSRRFGRAGTGGDREALLDQRDEPLLPRSLAPARQR